MSSFKEKFAEHIAAEEEKIASKKSADSEAIRKQQEFEDEFRTLARKIARPIFAEFVNAAVESGFSASYEDKDDGFGDQYLAVRFIPKKDVQFGADKRNESVFSLTCRGKTQKVVHTMYFDQRKGDGGKKAMEFGIQSISEQGIRRQLEEFMSLSLKSYAAI